MSSSSSSSASVKIRVHAASATSTGPVLASFLPGPPPERSLTGRAGDGGEAQFERLRFQYSADSARPSRVQLSAVNATVSYEARNSGESAPPARADVRYLLGALSRKRGRLDVYEVDAGGCVLGMRLTRVAGSGAAASAAASAAEQAANLGEGARRDILISSFGSRKKQAMDAATKANVINPAAVQARAGVTAALAGAARAAVAAAEEEEAARGGGGGGGGGGSVVPGVMRLAAGLGATSAAKVEASLMDARRGKLPPFDTGAGAPSEAYPLVALLPPQVAEALMGEAGEGGVADALAAVAAAAAAGGGDPSGQLQEGLRELYRGSAAALELARAAVEEVLAEGAAPPPPRAHKAGGAAGGGGQRLPLRAALADRLCAALLLRHLLAMHRAGDRLSFKPPRPAPAPEAAGGGEGAGAEGAPAPPPEGAWCIPDLRWVPAGGLLEHMLASFCEARAAPAGGGAGGEEPPGGGVPPGRAQREIFVRTPDLKDRLSCHMAAAALHAHGFPPPASARHLYDLAPLARDMRTTPQAAAAVFRELGCRAEPVRASAASLGAAAAAAAAEAGEEPAEAAPAQRRGGIVSYAVALTVPLTFPKVKMGAKKK